MEFRFRLIGYFFWVGIAAVAICGSVSAGSVRTYPAPKSMQMSSDFTVTVGGQPSPVYRALVGPADQKRLYQAMDDAAHSSELFDVAGFTQFDIDGPTSVSVSCPQDVISAKIVPIFAGITPAISGRTIHFTIKSPANLTLEVNGDTCHSLHLFANPLETDEPKQGDPNVVYFGPGIHDVSGEGITIGPNQTLYLAGGAVLRAVGGGKPVVQLRGDHASLRGRGIIDGTAAPTHSRSLVSATGADISIEGVILHDSAGWSMPIRRCDRITVRNVKIFSHRSNGDGIDLCNCRDALVENCFLRTLDDCIVVKADKGQGVVNHVLVQHCVLWNQVAHALSIGAELREPVDDVRFTDCDVIHDTGREWTLRIYNCDSATVTNTRFDHIRVEDSRRLISVWIGKAVWSRESERGHVNEVSFSDISAAGNPLLIDLHGFDARHSVEGVEFDHVTLNGKPMQQSDIKQNQFVGQVNVKP